MNKRVYGVLGISSIMANWNADFSGYPKTISDGTIFGSDKALKYPIKKQWESEGHKVLYVKSLCLNVDKKRNEVNLIPRTLKERYEYIFGVEDLKKSKNADQVLMNLFQAVDVKTFGATFAEEGINISITGAVQIGQGFNKYKGSEPQEQQILSPFRDPKGKEGMAAKSATLGVKVVSDEAHYFYPFVINPMAYKSYVELGVTDGYTEADYQLFKTASISAATSYATNSKEGCENEFALFVETEPDLYLPNLANCVIFEKGTGADGRNLIQIDDDGMLADVQEKIIAVEIYYNPYTTTLKTDIMGARYFNIITKNEVGYGAVKIYAQR